MYREQTLHVERRFCARKAAGTAPRACYKLWSLRCPRMEATLHQPDELIGSDRGQPGTGQNTRRACALGASSSSSRRCLVRLALASSAVVLGWLPGAGASVVVKGVGSWGWVASCCWWLVDWPEEALPTAEVAGGGHVGKLRLPARRVRVQVCADQRTCAHEKS